MPRPPMTDQQRAARFWGRVAKRPGDGCWEWTGAVNGPGYGKVYDGKRLEMAHRFAYRIVVGDIPTGKFLCHRCDNPLCVRPDHLFVGTQSDNARDAYRKGRLAINVVNAAGVGRPRKLTADKVRAIRAACSAGESQQSVADRLGVNQTLVSAVVRRKVWRHVLD